jgi:hypothetical protein
VSGPLALPLALLTGLALGFAGGVGHLLVTRWRASLLVKGGALAVVLTFPLALAPLAVAVLAAARIAPAAAWVAPVGLLLARVLLLRRLGGLK